MLDSDHWLTLFLAKNDCASCDRRRKITLAGLFRSVPFHYAFGLMTAITPAMEKKRKLSRDSAFHSGKLPPLVRRPISGRVSLRFFPSRCWKRPEQIIPNSLLTRFTEFCCWAWPHVVSRLAQISDKIAGDRGGA